MKEQSEALKRKKLVEAQARERMRNKHAQYVAHHNSERDAQPHLVDFNARKTSVLVQPLETFDFVKKMIQYQVGDQTKEGE